MLYLIIEVAKEESEAGNSAMFTHPESDPDSDVIDSGSALHLFSKLKDMDTPSDGVIEKTAGLSDMVPAHPRRAHAPARGSASKAGEKKNGNGAARPS